MPAIATTSRLRLLGALLAAALVASLAGAGPAPAAFGDRSLHIRDRGHDVRVLQSWLTRLGFETRITGYYGTITRRSVLAYERDAGLRRDGKVSRAQARRIRREVRTAPSSTGGGTRWTISGGGWGHGIGMSQYGAQGQAKAGRSYRQILAHYYRGTELGDIGRRTVRVLVKPNESVISFRGARKACGRKLSARSTYRTKRRGSRVILTSRTGRALRNCGSLLRTSGSSRVRISDRGVYRGRLEVRPAAGRGLNGINAVGLESYTMGVVPNESPASWEPAALQAQAVAARTYAIATAKPGGGFEHYDDTRSQVYRGVSSEHASTNAAVRATRGEIVTYDGAPAVTYFHSTSGGHTENIEKAWPGSAPKPWLKGVEDEWASISPHHRWQLTRSTRSLERKLGSLVKGSLRDIRIAERGVSPRIVRAKIVGSRGTTTATGPQLRARLGLRDTWARFSRVTSTTSRDSGARAAATQTIAGSVSPQPRSGIVHLQRRSEGRWREHALVFVDDQGRYRARVGGGTYRIRMPGASGPTIRLP